MKREILFRAQRVDNGEWVYGYVDANMYESIVVIHTEGSTHTVIPDTVSQFTGLTDKNGINIFEGDIVEVCGCGIASVIFNTSMASFMVLTKSKYNDGTNIHVGFEETEQDEIEVIGNIFDSPELLK